MKMKLLKLLRILAGIALIGSVYLVGAWIDDDPVLSVIFGINACLLAAALLATRSQRG